MKVSPRVFTTEELKNQPDNTISIQHFLPTEDFFEAAGDAKVITIIRNPYDTFVSSFFYANNFPEILEASPLPTPGKMMLGKDIEHPDVVQFIKEHFGGTLHLGVEWKKSGKSFLLKYEDLHATPFIKVKHVVDYIQPMERKKIERGVFRSTVGEMRKISDRMKRHVRKGVVGDWQNHLNEEHLEAFSQYSDAFKELGYEMA